MNLNLDHYRITLVIAPIDGRCGYDRLAAIGRIHCGIDVDNRRDALVFVSRRYSIAKVILRDNHGRTMITRWVDVGRLGYTTSRLEGCNQKIKTLKRSAYGFNDMDYFFLKIKSILPGKCAFSFYDRFAGAAIIKDRLWRGPWAASNSCCFHAQL